MNSPNPVIFFYRLLKNKPTVPRWIIFLLDLVICAMALFCAYLFRFNMDFGKVLKQEIIEPVIVVTMLNIIFFRMFRTYEGIIRLSSAQEGFRCVSAVLGTSGVLFASIILSEIFDLRFIVPTSVLLIYFFIASFLIFGYRIMIREMYSRSLKVKYTSEPVIIFGQTTEGSLLKNAIESISGHQYIVVAFVDDNENLWGKSIDKAKIYSWEQLKHVAAKLKTKYLFLSSEDIGLDLKNEIVDYCLAKKITVKVIPPVQKWVDGQLQTRQIKNLKIEDLLNRPSINLARKYVQEYMAGKRS